VNVVVQFKSPLTEAQHQKVLDRGGLLKTALPLVHGGAYSMPAGKVQDLANDPEVDYISPDRPVAATATSAAGASLVLPSLIPDTVNAREVWAQGYTGQGIGVAVIDSGIDHSLSDFGNASGRLDSSYLRILYQENFLVPANSNGQYPPNRYQTSDAYGHGST
jgi:subtilisin family serine protease